VPNYFPQFAREAYKLMAGKVHLNELTWPTFIPALKQSILDIDVSVPAGCRSHSQLCTATRRHA
jgi:hypothetical protein